MSRRRSRSTPISRPATRRCGIRARFHFGFIVPFVPHMGAAGVVEAVVESKGDLGLIPAFATAGSGPWWARTRIRRRAEDHRPAALCRTRRPSRRHAGLRGSRVAADAMVTETEVYSLRVSGWSAAAVDGLAALADIIAVPDRAFDGAALLVSVPEGGIEAVVGGTGQIRRLDPLGRPRRQPRHPLYGPRMTAVSRGRRR